MRLDNSDPLPEIKDQGRIVVARSNEAFYNHENEITALHVHYRFLCKFCNNLSGTKRKRCEREADRVLSKIAEHYREADRAVLISRAVGEFESYNLLNEG